MWDDERLTRRAQTLLSELAQNGVMDEYMEGVAEVPREQHAALFARQLSYAVSQTRLCDERKALGDAACAAKRGAAAAGLALAVDDFVEMELWVDVPLLWTHLAAVVLDVIARGGVDECAARGAVAALIELPDEWRRLRAACDAHAARYDCPIAGGWMGDPPAPVSA